MSTLDHARAALAAMPLDQVQSMARRARERWHQLAQGDDYAIAEHVLLAFSEPTIMAELREQYLDAKTAGATDEYMTGMAQGITTIARQLGQPHPWWLR